MSFYERRYIDQLIHLFAVPQYLYRLEENYMTVK